MLVSVEPKFEACSYIINTYNAKANVIEQQQQKEQNKTKNGRHNSHRLKKFLNNLIFINDKHF